MSKKSAKILTILILADSLALASAFFLAYFLRNSQLFANYLEIIQPLEVYLIALPAAVLLQIIIFSLFGLYQLKQRSNAITETYAIFRAVSFLAILIMAGSYLVKYDYSRIVVVLFWLISLITINAGRYIVRSLQKNGIGNKNFIIVGAGRPGKNILAKLNEFRGFSVSFKGFVDNCITGDNIIGRTDDIHRIIASYGIHQVYIADPSLSYQKILEIVDNCPRPELEFKIASNLFPLIYKHSDLNSLEEIPSLNLRHASPNVFYRFSKRVLDITASLPLFIALAPIMLLIALLVKKDSLGPAIIRQDRVGLNGKIFKIYKFRTMHEKADLYEAAPARADDPRITGLGKLLRKTSLDELPQLLNIIKGEMSLVGPRPEMPFIVEQYEEWQKKRLLAKPGLTGLWQILGRKNVPLKDNLEYDFYYINNQSFLLDLVILLKTIPLIIFGKGAY